MANVVISDTHLENIAQSIREKNGSTATYKPREMATAIAMLPVSNGDGEVSNIFSNSAISQLEYKSAVIPDSAFKDFTGLTRVRSTATDIGMAAFQGCSKLQYVYLRNAVSVGRENEEWEMSGPFAGCYLKHVDLGEDIEYFSLKGCYTRDLERIVIRKNKFNDDGSFTLPTFVIDYIPEDQRSGMYIYVPSDVMVYYENEQIINPNGNYAYFKLVALEKMEFNTVYGGNLS